MGQACNLAGRVPSPTLNRILTLTLFVTLTLARGVMVTIARWHASSYWPSAYLSEETGLCASHRNLRMGGFGVG